METVGSFAGMTITVGAVSSFVAQAVKRTGFFDSIPQKRLLLRLFVAAICVALNSISTAFVGGGIDYGTLGQAFVSYLVATATYEHLFAS